jgi:hypothetical protein
MLDYRRTLLAMLVAIPAAALAQPRPGGPGRGGVSASELLDARRQLDLTPRQVARLDSIERAEFRRHQAARTQLQALRDSVCPRGQRCEVSSEQRQTLRDRMNRLRDPRTDSAGRAMALSLLDSTQRGRVQGWRMRQDRTMARNDESGQRRSGPGMRGRGGERGFRGQDFGPGMRGRGFGPQGQGMRGRQMGPGWRRDDVGPRAGRRGPDHPMDDQRRRPRRDEDPTALPDSL